MNKLIIPVPLDRVLEEAGVKLAIAKQHIKQLSQFGINETWLDTMESEINQVLKIPSFEEQKIKLKELTNRKNDALNACLQWGKNLKLRMTLAIEDQKLNKIEFPYAAWKDCQRNKGKLISFFPTLIDIAKQHSIILATVGQTPEIIEEGEKLWQKLIAANQAQEDYSLKRKKETLERKILFRSLYDRVNRINKVGKIVYAGNDGLQLLFNSNW